MAIYGASKGQFSDALNDLVNSAITPHAVSDIHLGAAAELYRHLIDNAQWGRLAFDQSEQDKYIDLLKKLFVHKETGYEPSADLSHLLQLQTTLASLQKEFASTPVESRTDDLKARLKAAKIALNRDTGAQSLIPDVSRLRNLLNYDYTTVGQSFKARLAANMDAKSGKPSSSVAPKFFDFGATAGWQAVELKLAAQGDPTDQLGKISALPPVWCCSIPKDVATKSASDLITIRFDVLHVSIRQPWRADEVLLGGPSKDWKWSQAAPPLSRGPQATKSEDEIADLTSLPQEIILIRSLRISGGLDASILQYFEAAMHDATQVYFGPFVVGGEFKFGQLTVAVRPSLLGNNELFVPGVQAVAFGGKILPELPNADQTLIWGDPLPILNGINN
ncbi:hypothetical protein [Lichenifustis flavocetrariae]|uniref:Uncharacterized protein n=1 Tax=Lichenifustis flavocetrariae TaxID=2949735 RepID=A0AA42CJR0_9HYPH|nr:hypothetical protein [Lichenifustis flavocetrariae]MCW6509813.1 hypothetical protein [Lichenifustis flavocetrariae]